MVPHMGPLQEKQRMPHLRKKVIAPGKFSTISSMVISAFIFFVSILSSLCCEYSEITLLSVESDNTYGGSDVNNS
jgi:hypothetical protein